jgi:hypothetical protein
LSADPPATLERIVETGVPGALRALADAVSAGFDA